jgi:hypothetical protein
MGTSRHRRAFKIAAGGPFHKTRCQLMINWAVICCPSDWQPFSFLRDALSIAPTLSSVVEDNACTEQDNNNEQSDENSEDVSIHHVPTSKFTRQGEHGYCI